MEVWNDPLIRVAGPVCISTNLLFEPSHSSCCLRTNGGRAFPSAAPSPPAPPVIQLNALLSRSCQDGLCACLLKTARSITFRVEGTTTVVLPPTLTSAARNSASVNAARLSAVHGDLKMLATLSASDGPGCATASAGAAASGGAGFSGHGFVCDTRSKSASTSSYFDRGTATATPM